MSKSIMDTNLTFIENLNPLLMIPLAKFKLTTLTSDANLYINCPSISITDMRTTPLMQYRINCNHLSDYLYFYSVKTKKFIDRTWIHNYDIVSIPQALSASDIYVMAFPQTIYKMSHLNFESNSIIAKVYDVYTFNFLDYSSIFRNCYNITTYETSLTATNLSSDLISLDEGYNYSYAFANNFKATKLPSRTEKKYMHSRMSAEYMLMNTRALNDITFLNIDNGSAYLTKMGGNGVFFNSNIDPELYHYLDYYLVYEFINTFSGMSNSKSTHMQINSYNARSLESTFRDNNTYYEIIMHFDSYLKNMNNTFRNAKRLKDITQRSTYATQNLKLTEMLGTFADCNLLMTTPSYLRVSNTLKIACDVYKNCISLPNEQFFRIAPENTLIFSGIFNGCSKFNDLTKLDNSSSSSLKLQNVYIVNDFLRNCKALTSTGRSIDFGTTDRDIYADGFYAFTGLQNAPVLMGVEFITSCAEMFRGTSISSFDYTTFNKAKNVSAMFMDCKKLTSGTDFKNAVIATNLYANCPLITTASVNITNPRYLVGAFKNCTSLTGITSTTRRTCQVKDVSNLFEGCTSLIQYENTLNTEKAESFVNMFKGCTNLTSVSIDLGEAKNTRNIFYGCVKLKDYDLALNPITPTPYLSMRGTSLTIVGLTDLFELLPDVYGFVVTNPTNVLSGTTWTNATYQSSKTLYSRSIASAPMMLKPGVYTITQNALAGYDYAISIIDYTTGEVINGMVYNSGYNIEIPVNIQTEGQYYAVINTNYTALPPVSMVWSSPIYKIDIRNIPALYNLSPELLAVANEKGWQVICDDIDAASVQTLSLDDTPISNDIIDEIDNTNYMENINSTLIDENKWTTERFNLNKGYYTIYSKTNNNNNFKVYKIVENGEYPIAISYDDSVLCFEINDNTDIRIVFNNENKDIELLKS